MTTHDRRVPPPASLGMSSCSLAPADRAWRPKIAPVLTEGAAGDGSRGRIGATSSPTGQHPVSPSSARSGGKSSSAGPRRTPSGQSPEPGASSDAGGSDSPVRPRRLPPLSSSPSADSPASPELSRRILRVPSNIDRRDTAGGADHISRGSNGGGAASPLASERKSPRLRRMSIGRSSGSGGGNQPDASPRIDRRGSPSVSEGDGQPSGLTRVSSGRGAGTTASPGGGGKGERQTARTRAEAKDVSAFSLRDEQWDRDKLLRACRIVAGQLEEEAAGRGEAPTKGGRRQSRTVTPVAADAGPVVPSYNIWSKDLEAQLLLRASQVMRRERGPKLGQAGGVLAALRRAARDMRAASLITDHIVIGSKEDAANLDTLFGLGVTHVLNAAADSAPSPFEYDVLYFDLQLEDEADFPIAAFFRVRRCNPPMAKHACSSLVRGRFAGRWLSQAAVLWNDSNRLTLGRFDRRLQASWPTSRK